jgi:hypothetical protein
LLGEDPEEGGHYITIWAPRQRGKSWALNEARFKLIADGRFDVLKLGLEHLKMETSDAPVLKEIGRQILEGLNKKVIETNSLTAFQHIFSRKVLEKPLILILDEFDALPEEAISAVVGAFRNIYNLRREQADKKTGEKDYLLHSVALIGVRSVLGVDNTKGSPFNVQRSVHIPNLTFPEVESLFRMHEEESGRRVDQEVIERLFYETRGQPGLTCWFGELLTEGWDQYRFEKDLPLDTTLFDKAYFAATRLLPNNNIINIISKAKQEPYKQTLLEVFETNEKLVFDFDKPDLNFLYMNGVIDVEHAGNNELYAKFPCPFVQKRLFNYFADDIVGRVDRLYDPFVDIDQAVDEERLHIKNIMNLYRIYLSRNRDFFLKQAPRRSDMRIYEAVFHFNLYMYLSRFVRRFDGKVHPEFPTGNGKIDLVIKYADKTYGLELKSYTDKRGYDKALKKSAEYGRQLNLKEIYLVFFLEAIDDENRKKLEADFYDKETEVKVLPIFIETGE